MTKLVTTSSQAPNVYHTNEECQELPEDCREATEDDLRRSIRECAHCRYAGFLE